MGRQYWHLRELAKIINLLIYPITWNIDCHSSSDTLKNRTIFLKCQKTTGEWKYIVPWCIIHSFVLDKYLWCPSLLLNSSKVTNWHTGWWIDNAVYQTKVGKNRGTSRYFSVWIFIIKMPYTLWGHPSCPGNSQEKKLSINTCKKCWWTVDIQNIVAYIHWNIQVEIGMALKMNCS